MVRWALPRMDIATSYKPIGHFVTPLQHCLVGPFCKGQHGAGGSSESMARAQAAAVAL